MRDKLIELIDSVAVMRLSEVRELADYLIAHGVTIETGGDLLPRESVINGVLMQMQASSSPVCMEEFLRNLDGVTLAEDNNVLGKWIPVSESQKTIIFTTYVKSKKQIEAFAELQFVILKRLFMKTTLIAPKKSPTGCPYPQHRRR